MIDIKTLPTLQAAGSTTFTRPPFEQSLTVPELYAFHAQHSPDHPIFVFSTGATGTCREIRYPEAYAAIQRAHGIVAPKYAQLAQDLKKHIIVGVLANLDSVTYATFLVGMMHAGLTAFPISTRNSVIGVAHLIRTTELRLLFVSPDAAMQRTALDACAILKGEGIDIHILPLPQFEDLYNQDDSSTSLTPVKYTPDPIVLILHSSGSAAQPKPIPFSSNNFINWGCLPYSGEIDIGGMAVAAHSLPLFHAMGAAQLVWTICSGTIIACFKPSNPPAVPTPEFFLREAIATKSRIVFCVPMFVEVWARSPENIPVLRNLKALVYAGAPIAHSVGEELVAAGVNLIPLYATTETGTMSLFCPESTSLDHWNFFRLSSHVKVEMLLHDQSEAGEIVEPIVISTERFSPNVINTTYKGQPAYSTSDLLLRHPTEKDLYSVYGRVDDQLMLSTGEKTNPVPLETLLLQDKNIAAAIMFGRGRFQNGILIQPASPFNPEDEEKLAAFRNSIWPTVEKVNAFAPAHSRIFKEMILVTIPSKPLEFTPKGTPRRQVCLKTYEAEINTLYDAVKDSSQTDIPVPQSWTVETAAAFVDAAVRRVLVHSFDDNQDLFLQGCDSLQATWIRNSLLRAIRSSENKANIHLIPSTFIYSHPTIQKLGDYFWKLLTGVADIDRQDDAAHLEARCLQMESLVTKYTSNVSKPAWETLSESVSEEIILLTGSTGRLGCHILKQLINRSDVSQIYALNRPGAPGQTMEIRQHEALKHWGINLSAMMLKKVTFLEYDGSKSMLGLASEWYKTLQSTVTAIIHNGWRVDFNIGLGSFENLIAGTRQLLDLSLASSVPNGPRFIFVSSISVFGNSTGKTQPELPIPSSCPVGFGYGESKWVAENICQQIAASSGLSISVVRVGQLSGDTITGHWNVKEWVPSLIKLGKAIGGLPSRSESVSWLPVDCAAKAISDILSGVQIPDTCTYINLVHPYPVDWDTLFMVAADHLKLKLIPYDDWVQQLHNHERNLVNGAIDSSESLIGFFLRGHFGSGTFAMGRALKLCPSLRDVKPLESADIHQYLSNWDL